ncbi:thioredoxin-like domain-containing protein [Flavobacterium sp.]|uniref:thioredoxin-like domain-containing protein n=1 Tax=Flavobacterium sp. TaxID=239 RepID=UPI002BEDACA5|nr:thioredoxin-like domain-containing protein [Flavobacterium sp.]HSD08060.1 thioredoxin-like domain-containing protein [Flavobacterium sp.]
MKIKILLLLPILLPVFTFQSLAYDKKGKITGDLPNLKNQFDNVVITMRGFEEFGDAITTVDTVQAKGGKFEYHFSVPGTRMVSFTLLKNNEEVTVLAIKDAATSPQCGYFQEICLGNEDIKINNKYTFWPEDVVYCEGLKENKWYYAFDMNLAPAGDKVTKQFIKAHPNSYATLQAVFFQKLSFSNDELSDMLDLFSYDLKQSVTYLMIRKYLDKMMALEKMNYARNFNWLDINGTSYDFKTVLGDKKYVLLVFWSSTCKECSEEIAELKEFQEKYATLVSIVNLSVDNDYRKWKEAVDEEKIPWYNLSGLPNNKDGIREEYCVDTGPEFILVNSDGNAAIKNINTYFYGLKMDFIDILGTPLK